MIRPRPVICELGIAAKLAQLLAATQCRTPKRTSTEGCIAAMHVALEKRGIYRTKRIDDLTREETGRGVHGQGPCASSELASPLSRTGSIAFAT